MKEMMSETFTRTIEQLDNIQQARQQLLQACAQYESSVLVNCPMSVYDQLYSDYEKISEAVSHLLELGALQTRRAMHEVTLEAV